MAAVHFSCRAPNADDLGFEAAPDAIPAVAARAEELGFDAIRLVMREVRPADSA